MPTDLETRIRAALQRILDRYDGPMTLAPRLARALEAGQSCMEAPEWDIFVDAFITALESEE